MVHPFIHSSIHPFIHSSLNPCPMRIPFPCLLLLLLGAAAPGARAEFRAAMAVRIITPDPLLPVSGGVGPSHPTTRKSGELTGRALVLASGETRIAIVSVD